MTSAPPQGSPRAPHLSYSNPDMPRRSSYASVAAGTAASPQQTASVHLPRSRNAASSLYTQQLVGVQQSGASQGVPDLDGQGEGGASIPESWGRGRDGMSSFTSPRFSGQGHGSFDGDNDGFFKPTYLRESKYMESLEEAHKASISAQREEQPPRASNPGSLSKSPSTVSLPSKMQASHRAMPYDVIEHQPLVVDLGPTPLPSRWAEVDKNTAIEVGADGQEVRYVGQAKSQDNEAAAARSDHPMPAQCGLYYYEVYINSKGKDGMIGVGFSGPKASLEKLPGWEPDSWAYHGDDGKSFCCQSPPKTYGPTFTTGDIIGCGVNFMTGCAFFTKNGQNLGNAFRDIKETVLYPAVGMKRPHAHLTVNFGQSPFNFDIDHMMKKEKQGILDEISSTAISNLHPQLNKDELCKALVAQYLSHEGHVEAAKAFAGEVRAETSALRGSFHSPVDKYLVVEEDHDAATRQQIRSAILDGDIDETLKLTTSIYPHVLRDHRDIYFQLRCRNFIEMMRKRSELLDHPTSKAAKSVNGHSTATSEDGFEPEMDLDEPMKDGDDWDQMDTEENENGQKYDEMISRAIAYGRELNLEFKDPGNKRYTEVLNEIFGMLAYPDARKSPAAHLLESSQRVPLAEALNSAILTSLGRSSSTALERVYKQTVVLVDTISEGGGPGAFLNVRNIFKGDRLW